MVDCAGRSYGCPVEVTLDVLGGKWKTVILARIKEGETRFGMLRRVIPQLSAKVLTQRLRELEADGLVVRSILNDRPPLEIEYRLSERGTSLRSVLEALWSWGVTAVETESTEGRT